MFELDTRLADLPLHAQQAHAKDEGEVAQNDKLAHSDEKSTRERACQEPCAEQ